jgi:4a-hydroxytetrahydrobiopterin dehydratase
MPILKNADVTARLKTLPGWRRRGSAISREFLFDGFKPAMTFVKKVAVAAEASDHHPDIDIRWNRVTLVLSTHSEGGITGKDFAMALRCSALFSLTAGAQGR